MVFLILLPWYFSNKKQVAETQVVIFQCHVYQGDCLVIDNIHDSHFEKEYFKIVRFVLFLYHKDSLIRRDCSFLFLDNFSQDRILINNFAGNLCISDG